ncbi:hypothetical protein Bca52824_038069 [Brassica carinata]|uniref:Cytochrome c domain-containing protein n=1 Tax=Brassica carinata TaxID=52824 RepID=A0A8X7RR72_BRACI|nr:hypothetical protein Bca52824_038069 [Brassica carinata]
MVKRGAKLKNRNFNDEDQGSEVRTRSITPNRDEPDEVSAKHQQFCSSASPTPVAFQMQSVTPDNGQIMLAQGGYQKPKCSHCHRIGHTVDKCYKVHGYPPGHPQRGKPTKQTVNTNLATLGHQESQMKETDNIMTKDQIQNMIVYLSSQLQGSPVIAPELNSVKLQTPSPISERNIALSSHSVKSISQITGYKDFLPHIPSPATFDIPQSSSDTSCRYSHQGTLSYSFPGQYRQDGFA